LKPPRSVKPFWPRRRMAQGWVGVAWLSSRKAGSMGSAATASGLSTLSLAESSGEESQSVRSAAIVFVFASFLAK
jgi:hypothetical protein